MLNVIAITGFLGSGKTTLLQHLLENSPIAPAHSALLINDFGAVNLDAALVARPQLKLSTITGGCACCANSQHLTSALLAFSRQSELELLWMETSGLAEADEILDHLTDFRLKDHVKLQHLLLV